MMYLLRINGRLYGESSVKLDHLTTVLKQTPWRLFHGKFKAGFKVLRTRVVASRVLSVPRLLPSNKA